MPPSKASSFILRVWNVILQQLRQDIAWFRSRGLSVEAEKLGPSTGSRCLLNHVTWPLAFSEPQFPHL